MPVYALDKKPDGSKRRFVEAASLDEAKIEAEKDEIVGLWPDNIEPTGPVKPAPVEE